MSSTPKLSVVLPCFNELEHIALSLGKIKNFLDYVYEPGEYELILVDDGSTDGTRDYLSKVKSENVRVEFNAKNLGRGQTVKAGLRISRGAVVGFMDIDCEVAEYYLAKFSMSIESGNDIAIARRIYRVSPIPYVLFRHLLSVVYKFFLARIIKCPIKDTEAGFKFFSRRFADALYANSKFDGWFFDTECVLLAMMWGATVDEIPVAFLRNPQKTSTVKVFSDSIKYLRDISRYLLLKRDGKYAVIRMPGRSRQS